MFKGQGARFLRNNSTSSPTCHGLKKRTCRSGYCGSSQRYRKTRIRRARCQTEVERTSLEGNRHHGMWPLRFVSSGDLVEVVSEVAKGVAVVIAYNDKLKLSLTVLGWELEVANTRILFGRLAHKGVSENQKCNLVLGSAPSWIGPSCFTFTALDFEFRIHKSREPVSTYDVITERLLIYSK